MTTSPDSLPDDLLGESWVDLSEAQNPDRVTPVLMSYDSIFTGELQDLLWEAQRESNPPSARVSPESSSHESPTSPSKSPTSPPKSPTSPPKSPTSPPGSPPISPIPDLLDIDLFEDDLRGFYINHGNLLQEDPATFDRNAWVWQFSSRPDQQPPKEWKFYHPKTSSCLSMRNSKVMKRGLLSAEVFSILMITNLVSLLLGAGLGFYIGKRLGASVVSSLD